MSIVRTLSAAFLMLSLVSTAEVFAQSGQRTKARQQMGEPIGTGKTAPAVTLPTLSGEPLDLGSVFSEGKTVLVMLRGFPGYQCPLCSRQVGEYIKAAADFRNAGVNVVLVYPGPGSQLDLRAKEFLADRSLPSPLKMVLDPNYQLTDAYGLRWDAPRETAYPSTFVVEKGGKIAWANVSKTHGGRVAASDALTAATR